MRKLIGTALSVFAMVVTPVAASAAPFAGIVKTFNGTAAIVRNGTSTPAAAGLRIEKGDTVRTGPDGTIGIVFGDDSLVSLGPGTEVVIDDYLFDPQGGRLSFVARILRGTAAFLTGQIAKLAPKSVRLVMPTATIGVRGTHVLVSVQ